MHRASEGCAAHNYTLIFQTVTVICISCYSYYFAALQMNRIVDTAVSLSAAIFHLPPKKSCILFGKVFIRHQLAGADLYAKINTRCL